MLSYSLKSLYLDTCLPFCIQCLKEKNSGPNLSHSGWLNTLSWVANLSYKILL